MMIESSCQKVKIDLVVVRICMMTQVQKDNSQEHFLRILLYNKVCTYSNDFGVLPFQITIFIISGTRELQHLQLKLSCYPTEENPKQCHVKIGSQIFKLYNVVY